MPVPSTALTFPRDLRIGLKTSLEDILEGIFDFLSLTYYLTQWMPNIAITPGAPNNRMPGHCSEVQHVTEGAPRRCQYKHMLGAAELTSDPGTWLC